MDISEKIIDYIRKNRISTTEIADCMGKAGALDHVMPINSGHFKAGPIKWVYAYDGSNWSVHEQIRDTKKGSVVYIEAFNCDGKAVVGELVSKFLLLYKEAEAIITNAKMRDAHSLIKENYAIWCNGVSPIGCRNEKNERPFSAKIINDRKKELDGAIAVCDDSGAVVIPNSLVSEKFYDRLVQIERQEDIWFECIDTKKWDTFDTVCLKKYLQV